jgi:hypothetical protein
VLEAKNDLVQLAPHRYLEKNLLQLLSHRYVLLYCMFAPVSARSQCSYVKIHLEYVKRDLEYVKRTMRQRHTDHES